MGELRLLDDRDYFDHIAEPAYRQFKDGEVTFLVAYSMAAGLYHIAEWVWYHDEAKVKVKFPGVTSGGALWEEVEKAVPDAGLIRDMNNAAKHVKLSFDPNKPKKRDPSTTMYYAANSSISTGGFDSASFDAKAFDGEKQFKLDEGGRTIPLEPIATQVFEFWEKLINELRPRASVTITTGSDTSTATQ
jgi:hypothetical protein